MGKIIYKAEATNREIVADVKIIKVDLYEKDTYKDPYDGSIILLDTHPEKIKEAVARIESKTGIKPKNYTPLQYIVLTCQIVKTDDVELNGYTFISKPLRLSLKINNNYAEDLYCVFKMAGYADEKINELRNKGFYVDDELQNKVLSDVYLSVLNSVIDDQLVVNIKFGKVREQLLGIERKQKIADNDDFNSFISKEEKNISEEIDDFLSTSKEDTNEPTFD